ncbi:SO_0444 family Cu/Zn efflux transporter [Thalassotalea mangrovi]|uniref:Permease n=1 Tax=Thalassotalea mangrovi TaxID=2572245 RepID=A0A4U1B8U4_9GAMM|nr:SO_0444 family Cu/Zn efflux transporter [Thalassotalea mangrovi]TKB46945.1 permease [Thalassotalea mangrovi]
METLQLLINNFIAIINEASPWLLLGLIIAGLMKALVSTQVLSKHLGQGKSAVVKAAFIGAPLPLCSCGVIPVATQLHRSGASSPATSSFLVATPETGVDSVSVSYALLGPVMAIYRPIAAITSAIFTGFLVAQGTKKHTQKAQSLRSVKDDKTCCSSHSTPQGASQPTHQLNDVSNVNSSDDSNNKSHCATTVTNGNTEIKLAPCCGTSTISTAAMNEDNCCATTTTVSSQSSATTSDAMAGIFTKLGTGVRYAFTQLLDDLILWLFIGLLFATVIRTFLPTDFLLQYGSGIIAMLLMILISVPMYICATASTPLAAGLIMAGISPGTALVFMMAGPATNISTLGVIRNEMGARVLFFYLTGIVISSITFGLLLDACLAYFNINIFEQMSHSHQLLPTWFASTCSILLIVCAIKPLRMRLLNH